MIENGTGSDDEDENIESSIADIMAFQHRLRADPDSVSDEDIRAEYGDDIPPSELRELFRRSTFGKESKTPRASARAKLRRRLVWLKDTLEAVEHAVNQVVASPGRTYKKKELSDLLAAIDQFRATVKLPEPELTSPFDSDLLERLLNIRQPD